MKFFEFIYRFKFRYSLVIILLVASLLVTVLPYIFHVTSEHHWGLIVGMHGTLSTLLGISVKYYFDEKIEDQKVGE